MANKPLKMDKIHVFVLTSFTKLVITLHFSIFLHEIFRINVKLNFYLNLLFLYWDFLMILFKIKLYYFSFFVLENQNVS